MNLELSLHQSSREEETGEKANLQNSSFTSAIEINLITLHQFTSFTASMRSVFDPYTGTLVN